MLNDERKAGLQVLLFIIHRSSLIISTPLLFIIHHSSIIVHHS